MLCLSTHLDCMDSHIFSLLRFADTRRLNAGDIVVMQININRKAVQIIL